MYLVPIAWLYVVLMMAVAEATHTQGTLLGALITFVLYGLLPVALVMYLMGTPARRRARRAAEAREAAEAAATAEVASAPGLDPDRGGHAAGTPEPRTVATVREEP